jgi:hypothetical protein
VAEVPTRFSPAVLTVTEGAQRSPSLFRAACALVVACAVAVPGLRAMLAVVMGGRLDSLMRVLRPAHPHHHGQQS